MLGPSTDDVSQCPDCVQDYLEWLENDNLELERSVKVVTRQRDEWQSMFNTTVGLAFVVVAAIYGAMAQHW